MANRSKFGITECGDVYLLSRRGRKLLGRIGRLTQERTPVAGEIRAWWRKQITEDGLIDMLDEDSDSQIGPPSVAEGALSGR